MTKKIFFGTNLKMYKNIKETTEYLKTLSQLTKDISRDNMELFVIPSYTSLCSAAQSTDKQFITLGAQNMCWEEKGTFTGEISPLMLQEMGIGLVMIGHSERRHVLRETDDEENRKVKCALNHGMTALLCVGETAKEKDYKISDEVIRTQLKIGLHDIPGSQLSRLWIAYEPVWAIGESGTPASSEYAEEKHQTIKNCLTELFGEAGSQIPVLYGGSVNPDNAVSLISQPSVDGLFTGRSAWDASVFNSLIRKTVYIKSGSCI
ncbi:triose-phosphate isomerase [Lacrimispora amygdalina]|uniref:Triosephosphate isomerase n=1 Tax=Lacrimispora amygdalina TaxID=253257 RepID=A0A3E2NAA3_9FIRM|nr:triose-phosphate isomerase [Clostridium indicum]RFZ77937.1 triose-phosphate isomerase [Clostridium indicum]